MVDFFNAVFYQPLYNGLVFLIGILPSADVGIAVVILTLIVRALLLPVSIKATRTQIKMNTLSPKIREIQETYKKDREQQARKMMELYRDEKINPFLSFFVLIVQIPFIIALFLVFHNGLPDINAALLYPFIPTPDNVNTNFLGIINITEKSVILALLAGITQFIQSHLLFAVSDKNRKEQEENKKPSKDSKEKGTPSFGDEFAKNMNIQIRYVFPVITAIVAYSISGAIALYFIVSNIAGILQEGVIKRNILRSESAPARSDK
jgi:YidC/Oxa1 family membrane protein insertase